MCKTRGILKVIRVNLVGVSACTQYLSRARRGNPSRASPSFAAALWVKEPRLRAGQDHDRDEGMIFFASGGIEQRNGTKGPVLGRERRERKLAWREGSSVKYLETNQIRNEILTRIPSISAKGTLHRPPRDCRCDDNFLLLHKVILLLQLVVKIEFDPDVKIEFDPDKDAINRRKHGLSLAGAARVDIESAAVVPDERYAYGEARFRAYGWMDGRMHMLAFTVPGDVIRAISLRKANPREVKRYG
jgi:uncharacterized protein